MSVTDHICGISSHGKGAICALLAVLYALVALPPVMLIALVKWLVTSERSKRVCTRAAVTILEHLALAYRASYRFIHRPDWDVRGFEGLSGQNSYLVICNHQAWSDIPIMVFQLLGKTPFVNFFLKKELIWLPLIGVACWAMDFPFMQRYSKEELANNPELRGRDLETTRRFCEKLHSDPVVIVNYIEGTRFRPEKKILQQSPYRHLLKPKSGGVAYIVSALGDKLAGVIDITIVYPEGRQGFWQFLSGRLDKVVVQAVLRPIPGHLQQGGYQASEQYRTDFNQWVAELWQEKDALIETHLAVTSGQSPTR